MSELANEPVWTDEALLDLADILSYIVVYRVEATTIEVLRVLHARREYP